MKRQLFTSALIATLSLLTTNSLTAQDPPAETYQPGYWQPVTRVDPERPVEIVFVNQTGLVIEYALTTNEAPLRQLLPRDRAVLREIPIPAYVLINPEVPSENVEYETNVTNNVLTVTVKQISDDLPGDTTLNIHETGAVYIY